MSPGCFVEVMAVQVLALVGLGCSPAEPLSTGRPATVQHAGETAITNWEEPPAIVNDGDQGSRISISSEAGLTVLVSDLTDSALRGYVQGSRRRSEVGLGNHYLLKHADSGQPLALTIGVFGTARDAAEAADLSHRLMPDKPEVLEGVADEAWCWQHGGASAIRFRRGRLLVRIGLQAPLSDAKILALSLLDYVDRRRSGLRRDLQDGDLHLRVMGLRAKLRIESRTTLRLTVEPAAMEEGFTTGVWTSIGSSLEGATRGEFEFTAPSRPDDAMVRCFAVSEDNRVIVADRRVEIVANK